jgi:hypothetical protein
MPETKDKVKRGLAVFASGYAKRMMESQYDRLMETELGQKLRGLDKKYRYGIEAGLHALGAVIEQVLPEDKPAIMFFKQILEDAPAEIAKRLITDVRGNLQLAVQNAKTQEERMAIMSLLELDDESLKELLRWFGNMDPSERTRAEGIACNLASSDLKRMAAMSPEERKILVDIQNPPPPSKSPPKESELFNEVMHDMQNARQSLQQKSDELREKRRAKFHE